MLVTMTRQEIREEVQARMGLQSGSINAQAEPQLNAFIDQAYLSTLRKMTWVSTKGISRVTLSTDSVELALPANASCGSIVDIYRWDAGRKRHIYIRPGRTYGDRDWEPLNAVGGTEDEAARGEPQWWEEIADDTPSGGNTRIRFSPPADEDYEIHIVYRVNVPLAADATVCPIDGECVVLACMAKVMSDDGDFDAARSYMSQWLEAIDALRRAMHSGEAARQEVVFSMDDVDNNGDVYMRLPNWNLGTS